MLPPEIDTARLHLRPLERRDAGPMFAIMSHLETMQFWDWPAFTDRETVEDIVAGQIADMEADRSAYWTVCRAADGLAIGCCDLSEIDPHHGRAEVGFLFGRNSWGQGFAFEAMTAVIDYGFHALDLERLWARFHAGNAQSQKLLEKLGFSYEGRLAGHVRREGRRIDCILYGRLRN